METATVRPSGADRVATEPRYRDRERAMGNPLVLTYAACGTCKKALAWLSARGIEVDVRAIVNEPPRPKELDAWMPKSGLAAKKWLNTSGQSYKALGGKATFDGATDERIAAMLAGDGKLVKRPVLVDGEVVLVGFDEAAYAEHFASRLAPKRKNEATAKKPSAAPTKRPASVEAKLVPGAKRPAQKG